MELVDLQNENARLVNELSELKKALEKQKQLHRNFSEEVIETEESRIKEFKNEKKILKEEKTSLIKENRKLSKDLNYYKALAEAYQRDDKEESSSSKKKKSTSNSNSNKVLNKEINKLKKQLNTSKNRNETLTSLNKKLRQTNNRLSNALNKINKKREDYLNDKSELNDLIYSKKKNADVYNEEILKKLEQSLV